MKRFSTIIVFLLFSTQILFAQDQRLAQQYYNSGEYEKASDLFKKLLVKSPSNTYFFNSYLKCLINMEEYDQADMAIKSQIKQYPKNSHLYIELGNLYEKQNKTEDADQQFRKAIKLLTANQSEIIRLSNAFIQIAKYDLAIETYQKGNKALGKKNIFDYNIGDVYRRKGEPKNMILYYLNSLEATPNRASTIKTYFQRYLVKEDYVELKEQLYERIQEKPTLDIYPEILTWVFIQEKDFKNAFRQVKALDKRKEENGSRVFKLAGDAERESDLDAAIEAYTYIIEEKGKTCSYYIESKKNLLNCKKRILVTGYEYTNEDLSSLEKEYEDFLAEFGKNKNSAPIIRELAKLKAFYINDLDGGVSLLKEMIEFPGLDRKVKANSKLDLGDFYLMKSEVWESTLLYSQVDKDFKDDMLGEEARFRNAKLAYYNGDFEWAQAQLTVLKASTSELISNDAIDLSVFIMDHYSLDTTDVPMKMYARSDLFIFQNKFQESFRTLDSIKLLFPGHGLEDDILYAKSKIFLKQRKFDQTKGMLEEIIANYADGIRCDNAIFELAELYEHQLNDKEKAKNLYQQLLLEHSGSTFSVEARKRFRRLRGDEGI